MKLKENPRLELLYRQTNLIIPCELGQVSELQELLALVGEINTEKEYEITIKEKRKKRSLDANAYYYQLTAKCAEKAGISLTEAHNKNLADVGIAWLDSEGKRHWILQHDDDFWLKQKETHFCPTDKTEDRNGKIYRWFYLLKPSHLMDTKEMSRLIDYVVQDAKALGIPTETPAEIERIKTLWNQ